MIKREKMVIRIGYLHYPGKYFLAEYEQCSLLE